MQKKLVAGLGVTVAVLVAVMMTVVPTGTSNNDVAGPESAGPEALVPAAEVIMPIKSSRPGCELDRQCYIPEEIVVGAGSTVAWINSDAAFHSVTSGSYGNPDGLFDSGHMDPGETFFYLFEDEGSFHYYCTLHEWMSGVVVVKQTP